VTYAVTTRGLTVRRGSRTVLRDVDLSVPTGCVTGLLGPSGCGKTTLMRSIVGVQRIHSGSVRVLDRPAGSRSLREKVGYVTQQPSIYADLTVAENLAYFDSLYRADRDTGRDLLSDMGLTDMADQLVGELSGGQRARASLACALVSKPSLLILDEPTVGLDPVLRNELWHQFRDLADSGVTLLISSHVMDEAHRCDRLLLMREGAFIADDSPDALLDRTGADDLESAFLTLIDEHSAENHDTTQAEV
jgi:ABC-2 type transport system ATP-binding protein